MAGTVFMFEPYVYNNQITINSLPSELHMVWTRRPHKMPIEWLMVHKMEASFHLLHWLHVVCEHICWAWCFMSLGTRWRQLCGWNFKGKYRMIFSWKPSLRSIMGITNTLQLHLHISPCVCLFLSSFRKWLSRGPLHWQPFTPPAKQSPPSFHSPRRSALHQWLVLDSNDYVAMTN